MKFDFYMPVKVFSGKDCVKSNADKFELGKCAMIVTGASSAIKSGALDDVVSVLCDKGIEYVIFDRIRENPLLSTIYDAGVAARKYGCDFVIGIGGGSPMDAAKAIAAFAANPEIAPDEIYNVGALAPSLPIIEIPTTSGTGSEANPYSIITLDGEDKKKTFNSPYSYAKYAFLDYKYTLSLSRDYSLSTALDAFCHCIESYLSPKSTEISRMFALWGAKHIWDAFSQLDSGDVSEETREALMYASFAGGVAINTTGTGFPHPMGYNLTFHSNLPHGRACAAFIGKYIEYQIKDEKGKELICKFADALGTTAKEIALRLPALSEYSEEIDDSVIINFAQKIKSAGNFANAQYKISYEEMIKIYKELFQK
ncbi:MAG: iron-containing alcohol dehydrogenase [Clostridia bacterium]|nr:iron-containing alcohol dehydrogenase [Clostridia bacterium]